MPFFFLSSAAVATAKDDKRVYSVCVRCPSSGWTYRMEKALTNVVIAIDNIDWDSILKFDSNGWYGINGTACRLWCIDMVFFRCRLYFLCNLIRATYLSHLIRELIVGRPHKDGSVSIVRKWNDHAKFHLNSINTIVHWHISNARPLIMSMKYLYCRSFDKLVWQSQVIVIMSLNNSHLPPINLVLRCIFFVSFVCKLQFHNEIFGILRT